MYQFIIVGLLILASVSAKAQGILQNIQTAATLDVVLPMDFDHSDNNQLGLRSGEILFFGPLDPTFDANLNFAAHNHDGELATSLHEGFISTSKLIPQSRLKAGLFLLGVGRLNQRHQHDWSFISTPAVYQEFFGDEGVADTGLEFATLLPTDSFWEITAGITNGRKFKSEHHHDHDDDDHGHEHAEEGAPHVPTHYIKASNFIEFESGAGLQWGLSYLGNTNSEGKQLELVGLDFTYKLSQAKYPKFLIESELWYRKQGGDHFATTEDVGLYVFPQYGVSEKVYVGARLDMVSQPKYYDEHGDFEKYLTYAIVPTLTYKHSEFTLFRVAYTHGTEDFEVSGKHETRKIELQLIAILGAHPAHVF